MEPGEHIIKLVAYNHPNTPSARFMVGADTVLFILVLSRPQRNLVSSFLSTDSDVIDVTTQGIGNRGPIPTVTILSNSVTTSSPTPVITLASGSVYENGGVGDALWGIYLNDECPSNDKAVWTVNDLWYGAELEAPMYPHALYQLSGNNTLSLNASELSFTWENQVRYQVGAGTQLISMWGMRVVGSAIASTEYCYRADWVCVGSSSGWPGCLPAGSRTPIASTTFDVPEGHNGVILFVAKTRFQADPADNGGNAFLWINIDGVDVGTVGVQQLTYPDSVSSRTATASYLAAHSNSLLPGTHTVTVYAKADGDFIHLAATKDLPLIFFD